MNPSAAVPDTSVADAAMPDANTSNALTIRTYNASGQLVADTPVIFQDPTGAVISSTTSNAAGEAQEIVPMGSQVHGHLRRPGPGRRPEQLRADDVRRQPG